ncbi:hypothetical protein CVS29_02995 [Arthrobacter psychrochitiniphilus]|uniref:Uncharacterized protein n=1 Tax=Arthrobacter psychrochitiniphilus TaxID=291045 RepID=A0A2V3DY82_9MICC|nr:hypothetical protein CVS29_02995 [Arthrobacter psychrochitiniphilus]
MESSSHPDGPELVLAAGPAVLVMEAARYLLTVAGSRFCATLWRRTSINHNHHVSDKMRKAEKCRSPPESE